MSCEQNQDAVVWTRATCRYISHRCAQRHCSFPGPSSRCRRPPCPPWDPPLKPWCQLLLRSRPREDGPPGGWGGPGPQWSLGTGPSVDTLRGQGPLQGCHPSRLVPPLPRQPPGLCPAGPLLLPSSRPGCCFVGRWEQGTGCRDFKTQVKPASRLSSSCCHQRSDSKQCP